MDAAALVHLGDQLFDKRKSLESLWQEIGDHFYPERSEFTRTFTLGEDFASHLQTSAPILMRRELGGAFSSMLRSGDWFHIRTTREEREDQGARAWLDDKTKVQRRAMLDRSSQFIRATKEGDHDYATWGQCVISIELDMAPEEGPSLLYRNWHLRDVAWAEDYNGKITHAHRKWKPSIRDLMTIFPKVHEKVAEKAEKDSFAEIDCRHVVMPARDYATQSGEKISAPFVSIFLDAENEFILEETGSITPIYAIPRWQTVSGSQYAYSPATIAALPDARLIQAMTLTLLEAGEWAVSPPMLATEGALRSDLALHSRGVTWVDADYDERKGDAVRSIRTDTQSLPFGLEMSDRVSALISQAFFLNKLTLPQFGPEMTAFEVGQRIQEFIRGAAPVFEPTEIEYNGQICEQTFDLLLHNGAFGPVEEIPESLSKASVQFRFESPLREAIEREKGQKFLEAKQMLREAAEIDPTTTVHLDPHVAVRDVLSGIGTPGKWMVEEDDAAQQIQAQREQAQLQAAAQAAGQGAAVTQQIGEAAQALQGAA